MNTGLATGIAAGTSQITATLGSVTSTARTLTVIKSVSLQSIAVTPSNPSINQSQTQQFTATGTYSDGSTKNITTSVSWTSSNTAVAAIGVNTGLATGIAAGTSKDHSDAWQRRPAPVIPSLSLNQFRCNRSP